MRDALPDVPALSVLQRALRKTTETLAREVARPGPAVPDWSGFEWHIARAVVAIHGVSPLFAGALRWHGGAKGVSRTRLLTPHHRDSVTDRNGRKRPLPIR